MKEESGAVDRAAVVVDLDHRVVGVRDRDVLDGDEGVGAAG